MTAQESCPSPLQAINGLQRSPGLKGGRWRGDEASFAGRSLRLLGKRDMTFRCAGGVERAKTPDWDFQLER